MAYKKSSQTSTRRRRYARTAKTVANVAYKGVKAGASIASLARDVQTLKLITGGIKMGLNTEKKHKDHDVFTGSFAQTNANSNGIFMVDVTPNIDQGANGNERIGNSLKLTGMSFPVQFSGNSQTFTRRKIKMMLFKVTSANNGVSATDAITDYLDTNPLNGIIDYNSPKAYRAHTHDGVKLIRTKVYTLPAPKINMAGYNGDGLDDVEQAGFSAKFNVKMNEIVRFPSDAVNEPDGCRYYLYFMSDKGNCGTSPSTLDVPIRKIDTGVRVRCSQRYWWVDN